jgi:hypothetical protein
MGPSWFVLLTKYYESKQITDDLDGACGTYGVEEKCLQNFGGESWRKYPPRKTWAQIEGYYNNRRPTYDEILANINSTHFFMYLFISSLYMFRASQCSPSGDWIVLIHHLYLCSLLTGIPSSYLHKLIIPGDVLIQFRLLTISTVMLETCREIK